MSARRRSVVLTPKFELYNDPLLGHKWGVLTKQDGSVERFTSELGAMKYVVDMFAAAWQQAGALGAAICSRPECGHHRSEHGPKRVPCNAEGCSCEKYTSAAFNRVVTLRRTA